MYRCPVRPSMFTRKTIQKNMGNRIQHQYSYDRDIMCLPKCHADRSGLVKIPRKKSVLARNHLMGNIRLSSEMSEKSVTREVRSVFEVAMDKDKDFPFKILQNSGGSSRTLSKNGRHAFQLQVVS